MFISALAGFLAGLVVGALGWHWLGSRPRALKGDEAYLLAAAFAAEGRLRIRREAAPSGERLLLLKEFPNPRRMVDRGQVGRLLTLQLLAPDPSGLEDRYLLTAEGRRRAEALPPFPLPLTRPGSWFNSISKPRRRVPR